MSGFSMSAATLERILAQCFLVSGGGCGSLVVTGLWLHHPGLCLCCHVAFSMCLRQHVPFSSNEKTAQGGAGLEPSGSGGRSGSGAAATAAADSGAWVAAAAAAPAAAVAAA